MLLRLAALIVAFGLAWAQVEARFVVHDHVLEGGKVKTYVGTVKRVIHSEDELLDWIKTLEREPKNARFVYSEARGWHAVEKVGYRVPKEEALAAYREALAYGKRVFYLPQEILEPVQSVHGLELRGIRELVAEGVTDFRGSSWNRVYNLKLAARKLDGLIIPQGAVFSFNQALGPVDEEHGYKEGYVILGDRTEKDVGGGVCQVSSTVYRAAFFAGLPILERKAHSYLLRYYRPAGLDATVYSPWVDLKFKNDTPGDLLLRTYVRGTKLIVRLFGTKDREVRWEGPIYLEKKPPLPPREIVDETLPPGTRKQVDWPAPGAKVLFKRWVEYADGRVKEEAFLSEYKPWGAVYLVGPEPTPAEPLKEPLPDAPLTQNAP